MIRDTKYTKYEDLGKYDKEMMKELIFAQNKHHKQWGEHRDTLFKSFDDNKNLLFYGAFYEKADKKGDPDKKENPHYHIFLYWKEKPKDTTFRSFIQKTIGKSNTLYDWKYRVIKDKVNALKYITKDNNLKYSKNWPEEFKKYHGTWKPINSYDRLDEIRKKYDELLTYVKLCSQCQEWQCEGPCLRDCIRAVKSYYDDKCKFYDIYFMQKMIETLYYKKRDIELEEYLLDKIKH